MLDRTHKVLLRGVAKGVLDGRSPPELQPLIDGGCVEVLENGRYALTERGRRVLDFGNSHRLMARGVAQGIPDGAPPAPALRDLIEAGIADAAGDRYTLTPAGRALLASGE